MRPPPESLDARGKYPSEHLITSLLEFLSALINDDLCQGNVNVKGNFFQAVARVWNARQQPQ